MASNQYLSRIVKNLKEQYGTQSLSQEIHDVNDIFSDIETIENAVIGTILLSEDSLWKISDILQPKMIRTDSLREIYKSILMFSQANKTINILTIAEHFERNKPENENINAFYISQLTNVATTLHIKALTLLVIEHYIRREIQRMVQVVNNMVKIDAPNTVIEYINNELFDIENIVISGNKKQKTFTEQSEEIVDKYFEKTERLLKGEAIGTSYGFNNIDVKFNRIQDDDFVVIAARPSMGKTSLAINCAINLASQGIPVAFFSIESSEEQITNKIASNRLEIPYSDISEAKIDCEKKLYEFQSQEWANIPIYIDDTSDLTPMKLKSKLRRLIKQFNVKIAFIDYLQKMKADEKAFSKNDEIGDITNKIKAMNKYFKIPIIALAQLNRGTEAGNGTRPALANLRHSGEIEQDADIIHFIHREAYYDNEMKENERFHETEIICAKNRNGKTGIANLTFDSHTTSFYETDMQKDLPF